MGKIARIHEFSIKTNVRYGFGAAKTVGQLARELGCKNALVVTDPGLVKAGLAGTICGYLDDSGIGWTCFDKVEPEFDSSWATGDSSSVISRVSGLGNRKCIDTRYACLIHCQSIVH
ncbi:MAG: iron-containing alcohol dehydrogenase, partial [Firmicutes bacterium]|nr:iron-containing alcohol dehydrogenase [Bacillota bacterium]